MHDWRLVEHSKVDLTETVKYNRIDSMVECFIKTSNGVKQLGVDFSRNGDPSYLPSNLALRYLSGLDPGRS